MSDLSALYRARFSDEQNARKEAIWQVLCQDFFQQFVPHDATVLEIAPGRGEFSKHISAGRKLAIDLNPDSATCLPRDVSFFLGSADNMDAIASESIDICFSSNFLEHLESKKQVDQVLREIYRVLRPNGRYLALQPNIRFCYDRYWDFYDHHTALSDRSIAEALTLAGFVIERNIPRFLPFTTKSALPQHPLLVKMYLRIPIVWRVLGEQCFTVAKRLAS